MRGTKRTFVYCGGKVKHLDFILPLIPDGIKHFVEVYGGSGVVCMNVDQCKLRTYNDIDDEVVNFFQCLRDEADKLIPMLKLTPYARTEFVNAYGKEENLSNLERARRFFVRVSQTRNSIVHLLRKKVWSQWGIVNKYDGSPAMRIMNTVDGLALIVNVLQTIQIENRDAVELMQKLDGNHVFFYCDPPYVKEIRGKKRIYQHEMTDVEHEKMADVLHGLKARIMLSGYRSELYDRLFKDWKRVDDEVKPMACRNPNTPVTHYRAESVWLNYEPGVYTRNIKLFDKGG